MRSNLIKVADPLERLRSAGDLAPDFLTDAQAVATELNSVIAHLGELQGAFAGRGGAVAGRHGPRPVGTRRRCDSRDQPRGETC